MQVLTLLTNGTIYGHKNHFVDPTKENETSCFTMLPIISRIRLMCESTVIQKELHRRKISADSDSLGKICDLAHHIVPGTFVKLKRSTLVEDWDHYRNEPFSMGFPIYMEARNRDVEVFISLPKIIGQTKRLKIRYAISILFKDISQVHVDIEVHSAIKQSSCLASSNNRISVMEDIKGCPYILEAKSWGTSLGKTGLKMQLFSNRFHGDLVDFFKILNKNSYHPALHYRNMTKLAYDMARAFKHLHTTGKGYIHKDVKPKNIFINWGFTQHKVPIILHSVLGDYDLAAPLNDENKRLKTSGTLSYLSPEMVLLANKDNLPFSFATF